MSEWPVVEFQELASEDKSAFSKPYGSAITKEDYVFQGVPVVRGGNLRNGIFLDNEFVFIDAEKADQMPGANLCPGDLVFTHRGTIGQVSMIPRCPRYPRYVLSTSQVKARLDFRRAYPEFYYYWFSSTDGQHEILSRASTVGVPGLGQPVATIKSLRVPNPPLLVQKAIASILGTLDDKIAVNDRIADTVAEITRLMLEGVLRQDADSSKTFLADVASVNELKAIPVPGKQIRYIDISSVSAGKVHWPSLIPWDSAPGRARRRVLPGDTIWSTVRPSRRSFALILDDDSELVVSTGFAVLSPRKVGPAFLYEVTKRDNFVNYLENVAEGSAYPAVRAEKFGKAIIPLPSPSFLERFEAMAITLMRRVDSAQRESRVLAQLRDTLLHRLMLGEIQIRYAEQAVEEAT